MSHTSFSRRAFLKWGAAVGSTTLLAACTSTTVPDASSEAAPSGEPTEIVVWYQDWDGANRIMNWAQPEYEAAHENVSLDMQAIGFGDLLAKLLPSIAAGTEGDVMMMYTDWVVATDITQVFLDITEPAGGIEAMEEEMWPAAFTAIDVPGNKVFYLPWLAGIRSAAVSVNTDHLAEQSIDYMAFETYEDVVEAGAALTQANADGKITRAGYSPQSSQYTLMWSLIWQMGGEFYDKESGTWSFNTDIGQQAAQIIYDNYWTHQTCDFELFTSEFEAVSQQLVSIWGDGAWTASVQNDVAEVPADNIVTPPLANAEEYVLYPEHIAGWGLSKRLVDDADKLDNALDFAKLIVSPDSLIQAFEFYSGVCMTKAVYEDPRIEDVAFGLMSKRIAEGMWPVARFAQDRVAQHGPAGDELDRAMRQEITIPEALANIDAYLQEQEDQARERTAS